MPHEGTTQTRYRIIGKDNSRYLTFHNGGNFNIGCNVNTTIISSDLSIHKYTNDLCVATYIWYGCGIPKCPTLMLTAWQVSFSVSCSNMWAQLEVKKLYVEHVIIPVNQERQTKQNFNLKTLITVCTIRFVLYSKRCLIHTVLRVYMFIYNDCIWFMLQRQSCLA